MSHHHHHHDHHHHGHHHHGHHHHHDHHHGHHHHDHHHHVPVVHLGHHHHHHTVQATVTPSTTPGIVRQGSIKEGYLTKQGGIIRNWKRRLFILNGMALYYFVGPSSTQPQGVIQLRGATVVKASSTGTAFPHASRPSLVFALDTQSRRYYFEADNETEYKNWTEAIQNAARGQLQTQQFYSQPQPVTTTQTTVVSAVPVAQPPPPMMSPVMIAQPTAQPLPQVQAIGHQQLPHQQQQQQQQPTSYGYVTFPAPPQGQVGAGPGGAPPQVFYSSQPYPQHQAGGGSGMYPPMNSGPYPGQQYPPSQHPPPPGTYAPSAPPMGDFGRQ